MKRADSRFFERQLRPQRQSSRDSRSAMCAMNLPMAHHGPPRKAGYRVVASL